MYYEIEDKTYNYFQSIQTICNQGSHFKLSQSSDQLSYNQFYLSRTTRNLTSTTDPIKSVVSGNGTLSVVAFQTYRITVTAKDSTDANIGHGGDTFYVSIYNKCTPNSDFTWTEVVGARQVLNSPIITTMIDNGDGTYYYDYSVQLDGTITVLVALKQNGVYSIWYNNNLWSGSPSIYNISTKIDYDWGTGWITQTRSDLVTVIFKFFITVPISDAYTFYTASDDDWSLYVDGVPKLNNYSGSQRTQQTTINLVKNQLYSFIINYRENSGYAYMHFYWSSSNFAQTIVPDTSMFYLVYVSSFPITVTSSCPTGYSGSIFAGQTKCLEVWGDSIRVGVEQCDDGNTVSSDGCSSTCKIESGWVCSNNSTTHRNVWTQWAAGYEPNSDKDSWVSQEIIVNIQNLSYMMIFIIVFGMVWNVVTSILNKRSAQSSLSFINFVQLIIIIPLIGAYLSPNVLDFIKRMNIWLFSFKIISTSTLDAINPMKYLNFNQDNSYLQSISLNSGSSSINIFYIIGASLLFPFAHAIIFICNKCIQNKFSENKCTHVLIRKLYRTMTFGWYIKFILEIYVFLLLASISEVYMFSNSNDARRVSLSIACLIITFCAGFVCLAVWQYFKSLKDVDLESMIYFTEFFSGIKATGKARVFSMFFLLRRIVFCWIVLLLHHTMSLTLLNSTFVLVQLCYLSFCVIVRPFSEVKDNILEIINEVFYLMLWSSLIYYRSVEQWSLTFEYIFILFIALSNMIFASISFGNFK